MRRNHDQRQRRCGMWEAAGAAESHAGTSLQASVAAIAAPGARAVPVRALERTQRTVGNAAMQRLLTTEPLPVQRWDVKLAPTASCNDVLAHIARRSPYAPQAAYTNAHFKYSPTIEVSGQGSKHTATITDANVEDNITVDMPNWSPEGAMQRPWAKATRALRDHEATHETVAQDTKPELRTAIEAITATAGSAPAAKAEAQRKAVAKWRALLLAYQKKQNALDPYDVELVCP